MSGPSVRSLRPLVLIGSAKTTRWSAPSWGGPSRLRAARRAVLPSSARLCAERRGARLYREFLLADPHRLAVRLDREKDKGQSVQQHSEGEEQVGRQHHNGTGIAPELREKLFQLFFMTKPTGEGTGLGLSISWDIVIQQHGTIAVDSRVGEFTEFTIRLPRRPHPTPPPQAEDGMGGGKQAEGAA
jgi:hypothetical protein